MSDALYAYILPIAFWLFVACFASSCISALTLLLFTLRKTNEAFQHPYLKQQPFARYPFPIRLSILMDYFFRICFPRSRFWLVGQANQMLAHVDPERIPTSLKWPVVGLWGGCYVGLLAIAVLWAMLLMKM
jgi:hypothetical protein